jgi:hypothetical protein
MQNNLLVSTAALMSTFTLVLCLLIAVSSALVLVRIGKRLHKGAKAIAWVLIVSSSCLIAVLGIVNFMAGRNLAGGPLDPGKLELPVIRVRDTKLKLTAIVPDQNPPPEEGDATSASAATARVQAVFSPLLEGGIDKHEVFPINSSMDVAAPEGVSSASLYDHLINEDGSSCFASFGVVHELEFENGHATMLLSMHQDWLLSSDSHAFDAGSIRGFRLVYEKDGEPCEYVFVVRLGPVAGE